jgi:hypothetical protein
MASFSGSRQQLALPAAGEKQLGNGKLPRLKRKPQKKPAESQPSGARGVSWHFLVASTIPFADRFATFSLEGLMTFYN